MIPKAKELRMNGPTVTKLPKNGTLSVATIRGVRMKRKPLLFSKTAVRGPIGRVSDAMNAMTVTIGALVQRQMNHVVIRIIRTLPATIVG